jgi:guanylate kinase
MRGESKYVIETLESLVKDMGKQFSICIPYSELNESVKKSVQEAIPNAALRFLDCSELSLAEALNLAVETSKKEFILRIDSDDKVIKGRTQQQHKILQEDLDTAVVGSQVIFIDENSDEIGKSRYDVKTSSSEFAFGCRLAHPSVMFRRSQILSVGNYQDICNFHGRSICEDYDLWLRVVKNFKIEIIDEPLTEYRIHKGQSSHKFELAIQMCSFLLRAGKILGTPRRPIEISELSLSSSTFKNVVFQMRRQETPESYVWLLDYSIFITKGFFKLVFSAPNSGKITLIKNLDKLFFAFKYLVSNRGSYETHLSDFRRTFTHNFGEDSKSQSRKVAP